MEICPENKLHRKILDDFTLNDLDAKFIDREELTEKIIEKIGNIWGQELVDKKGKNIKEINEFANEILELLK